MWLLLLLVSPAILHTQPLAWQGEALSPAPDTGVAIHVPPLSGAPSRFSPNKLVLTDLQVFGKSLFPSLCNGPGQEAPHTEKLVLEHWQNDLTLCFATTYRQVFGEALYSYRLEGYDQEWSPYHRLRSTRYTCLPYGDYLFRLRAVDGKGRPIAYELALEVVLLPPWYATWWARSLIGLLVLALLYVGYRLWPVRKGAAAHEGAATGGAFPAPEKYRARAGSRADGHRTPVASRAGRPLRLYKHGRQPYATMNMVDRGVPILLSDDNPDEGGRKFLVKAEAIVMKHMSNPDFNLHFLCREIGMARSPLHNKLKALTGRSTTRYIRGIRLHYARQLLGQTTLPVFEVAFQAGFKDPNFFSTCFKEEFGLTPTGFRKGC